MTVRRAAPAVIAAGLGLHVVAIGIAMALYPGGHEWDRTAPGHDFWRNYVCDLARTTALNGEPNAPGSRLARFALLVLVAAGAVFWWSLAPLLSSRASGAVRIAGSLSCAGALAVAVLPADRFGALHPFAMALCGGAGLAAGVCAIAGLGPRERAMKALGLAALLVCGVDLALYASQLSGHDPGPVVPLLERVALLLTMAWMGLGAWRLHRVGR